MIIIFAFFFILLTKYVIFSSYYRIDMAKLLIIHRALIRDQLGDESSVINADYVVYKTSL